MDASVVACWYFDDENDDRAIFAIDRLAAENAVVPSLWWFEVRNVLIVNERRGRIDPIETAGILSDLEALPISIDRTPDSATVLAFARTYKLTAYDAAYLELADRLGVPLATLDADLVSAASAAGVPLLESWPRPERA